MLKFQDFAKQHDLSQVTLMDGWTCTLCNMWVPPYTFHLCSGYSPPVNHTVGPKLDKIIELLEQIKGRV